MLEFHKFICYDYCTNNGDVIKPRTSTFMEYSSSIVIIVDESIAGSTNGEMCSLFSPFGRDLFVNALQLFKDMFDSGKCLPKLNPEKILVMLDEGNVLKLAQDVTLTTATSALIDMNLAMLGKLFNTVLSKYPNRLEEINDMLFLLKANGSRNLDLIYNHSSWTDICEKKDLFVRLHNFFITRVKPRNIQDYEDILKDLVFPLNWESKVELNSHLRMGYNARNMQHKKKKEKKKKKKKKKGTVNGQASSSTVPTQSVQSKLPSQSANTESAARNSANSNFRNRNVQRSTTSPVTKPNAIGQSKTTGVQNGPLPTPDAAATASNKKSTSYTAFPRSGATTNNLQSSTAGATCPGLLTKVLQSSTAGTTCLAASDFKKNSTASTTSSASQPVPGKNYRNNAVQNSPIQSSPGVNTQPSEPPDPKYNAPGSDPAEEVMSYYRNFGTHGMEYSLKKKFEKYNFRQLNIMLIDLLPSLCSSLMRALYKRGYLRQIDLPKILK